ncbi:MAG: ribonuclease III [Lachnospiraceae bacterium]|nr:ribonuclease III [Lachnospiraceae bacterium]
MASVLDRALQLPEKDWSQYPALTLAWIGDTVYDLIVRTILLKRSMMQPDKLHLKASRIVNARAQAERMKQIRGRLSDREESIYRRGRNAKPAHKAKNADMREYMEATGFECLIGYLYLTGQNQRIIDLVLEGDDSLK